MKKLITSVFSFFVAIMAFGADNDYISLGAFVSDEHMTIPTEAASILTNRMQRIIAANGFADKQASGRFALVAKCDVLEKYVAPTTPPRISQKLELSFVVVDLIQNKVYGSCDMTVSGIGANETKAYSTAFQKVSIQNQQFCNLLTESKDKILDYYTTSCPQIQTEAKTLASTGQFDKAIFSLMSVPPVCSECYKSCQLLATEIYQQKTDTECKRLLEQAKSQWASSQSETTVTAVADIIGRIDPRYTGYSEVVEFRNSVSAKLAADAQRQWEFQMKKYEDDQRFKLSVVDACRTICEIFAKNFSR